MKPDAAVAQRFILAGAAALVAGIALAATGRAEVGSVVTLAAWAAMIAGLHTFGRAGPDEGR